MHVVIIQKHQKIVEEINEDKKEKNIIYKQYINRSQRIIPLLISHYILLHDHIGCFWLYRIYIINLKFREVGDLRNSP